MARFDNPAGRLHEVLRVYQEADSDEHIRQAWSAALNCPLEVVPYRLGSVLDLFGEVSVIAEQLDLTLWPELDHVAGDIQALYSSVFNPGLALTSFVRQAQVNPVPLRGLAALSLHLSRHEPQASLPESKERVELINELTELSSNVRASDIDSTVKRLMLQRIQQMIRALDALEVVGAEGVHLAAESLLATVVIDGEGSPNRGLMNKAAKLAKRAIVAVGTAGALSGNLIAVDDLTQRVLDAGAPQAQLNSGPPVVAQDQTAPAAPQSPSGE